MHGRDATAKTWPEFLTEADDDAIGDEMHRIVKGTDFGWPYSYYDGARKLRLVSPEYGGNGKTDRARAMCRWRASSPCGRAAGPGFLCRHADFPAHYRGGAFLAMHGGADGGAGGRPWRL